MNGIMVRRPKIEELDLINAFFEVVLKDTFEVNGISDLTESLEEEIQDKKRCISQDFKTNGKDRFFLLAEYNGEIIGSIEYGLQNELLKKCTNNELEGLYEVGTVFVHPKYQRQGVSLILLYNLFRELYSKLEEEICFDSGYPIAQRIWCKKFGDPAYCLKDFWGEGSHHMVWRVKLVDALELLRPIE